MKKTIALILVICLTISVLCSCSFLNKSAGKPAGGNQGSADNNNDSSNTNEGNTPSSGAFSSELNAEKVGSINVDGKKSLQYEKSGIIYQSNEKYGIMSLDGSFDSGAKYTYCKEGNSTYPGYFYISEKQSSKTNLNVCGIVDNTGKEVVPQKYATLDILNKNYAKVSYTTKKVNNKKDALIFQSDNQFAISASDGDTLYAGKWLIYDLTTGQQVKGVGGTKPTNINAYGKFIKYSDAKGNEIIVDNTGKKYTDGRTLYADGSYSVGADDEKAVYSEDGTKLFNYSEAKFSISSSECDGKYFEASSYNSDTGKHKYFILDKNGKTVSGKYDTIYKVEDGILATDDSIYTFGGKLIAKDAGSSIHKEEAFNDVFYSSESKYPYYVYDKDGNIIYSDKNGSLEHNSFNSYKKGDIGKPNTYYSYVKKNYITGSEITNWLIKKSTSNSKFTVIDLRSGKTLIDKPYDSYYTVANTAESCYYVYACPEYSGNKTIDLYKVTN